MCRAGEIYCQAIGGPTILAGLEILFFFSSAQVQPMLPSTFSHIPGIGLKTEQRFWENGVCRWNDFDRRLLPGLSPARCSEIEKYIEESLVQLNVSPNFFTGLLKPARHWRIFPHFRAKTAYLDIETTGGAYGDDHITAITLYDGNRINTYVWGENLEDFLDDVFSFQVLVTFNGKSFDVPMIERHFSIKLEHAHIDLRYVLASLGYKGGLKSCEKQLHLHRGELEGVDGYFAVLLWYEYINNHNQKALETMLAYNVLDTVNLEVLMVEAYNLFLDKLPFAHDYPLDYPVCPSNPFIPDYGTIDRLRSKFSI